MITCIAIDDEPLALKQICSYIEQIPYLELRASFSGPIKALSYLQQNEIDLMFVDINMPNLSGLEFVKSIVKPPKVMFTTAYREYAVEGFQVDAADYLVKPISFARLLKSVEKTKQRYFTNDNQISENVDNDPIQLKEDFLFIKSDYKIIRISLNDIKYIEGMRDYVRIHLIEDKPVMTLFSMKNILEHLPASQFMRIHRSYIVNLSMIKTIDRNKIFFDKNEYILLGNQYKEAFHQFLDNNYLK
jgi:two-component system LytT family response regulator